MHWRNARPADLELLVTLNRQLQEDEGSEVMPTDAIRRRMQRWLQGGYQAMLFEEAGKVLGYAVFNDTDPDLQGPRGIYLRHFFITRDARRCGIGRHAFELLRRDVWPPNRRVLLDAMCSNPAGQQFWRALGFREYSINYELRGGD